MNHDIIALPQIVQTLLELSEQVESNNISESDARDRVEQVIESLNWLLILFISPIANLANSPVLSLGRSYRPPP